MQVQTHSRRPRPATSRRPSSGRWRREPSIGAVRRGPGHRRRRGYGDLVEDEPLDVTVHADFSWWLEEEPEPGSEVAVSLERANAAIMPTARMTGLTGAYWVDAGDRAHLRWVRAEDEPPLMAALARLAVDDQLGLGEGSRYVGSFRAHGRLVPVWDLDRDAHPTEWEAPALAFAERLDGGAGVRRAADRRRSGARGTASSAGSSPCADAPGLGLPVRPTSAAGRRYGSQLT